MVEREEGEAGELDGPARAEEGVDVVCVVADEVWAGAWLLAGVEGAGEGGDKKTGTPEFSPVAPSQHHGEAAALERGLVLARSVGVEKGKGRKGAVRRGREREKENALRKKERPHRTRGEAEHERAGLLDGVPARACALLAVDAGDVAEEVAEEVDVVDQVDCGTEKAGVSGWSLGLGTWRGWWGWEGKGSGWWQWGWEWKWIAGVR